MTQWLDYYSYAIINHWIQIKTVITMKWFRIIEQQRGTHFSTFFYLSFILIFRKINMCWLLKLLFMGEENLSL